MAGKNGKLEIGQVVPFKGQDGLPREARITDLTAHRVSYEVRKVPEEGRRKGRFSKTPVETTRRAFRTMIG